MGLQEDVIRHLASGQWCSGVAIAEALGVSRAAVWKHVRVLPDLGLPISATVGRGYRLQRPLDLLDPGKIIAALDEPARCALDELSVVPVTGSTSDDLLAQRGPEAGRLTARLAEYQACGRGRRGRAWWSAYGSGLCMSVATSLAGSPRELAALSLAVGTAAHSVLSACGGQGIRLKWPNDLVTESGKVGGILVDVTGESGGPLKVVVGLGVNLAVPPEAAHPIPGAPGLPPAGMDFPGGVAPSRNGLAAGLISGIFATLRRFGESGFQPFLEAWRANDFLLGKTVVVTVGTDAQVGVARGVNGDGSLRLETAAGMRAIVSGDVSVRTTR
jgi:BirA family biotin operon repressor/biotin-[acetyl-CoA-carboxylase] ligase